MPRNPKLKLLNSNEDGYRDVTLLLMEESNEKNKTKPNKTFPLMRSHGSLLTQVNKGTPQGYS